MKQLLNSTLLPYSFRAGVVITTVCVPYIYSVEPALAGLRMTLLLVVAVCLWQMYAAWTPADMRTVSMTAFFRRRELRVISMFAVPLWLAQTFFLDSWFASHIPGFMPANHREFFVRLPWILSFQPLFLFAAQFAFAFRLTHRSQVAVGYTVIFNQLLVWAQLSGESREVMVSTVIVTGVFSLLMAICCRYAGMVGLSICSALFYSRFLLTL